MSYVEFRNCAVRFDSQRRQWKCLFFDDSGEIRSTIEELEFSFDGYTELEEKQLPSVKFPAMPEQGHWDLNYCFSDPRGKLPRITLNFQLFADRIEFTVSGSPLKGHAVFRNGRDAEHEVFATAGSAHDEFLYCASGPARHTGAAMLYNRVDDSALSCEGGTMSLVFDWKKREYCGDFTIEEGKTLIFRRKERICQTLFHLPSWAPPAREHQFPVPPVGWMTWYSLRFDTCETAVLENAKAMRELFRNFTEKICIWIDWEWCHSDFKGQGCEGADVFHPRSDAYPHGLKFVAGEIRKMDEIPALWCGATVEGRVNKVLKKHPEYLLADFPLWPGHLWFDLTHPGVAERYIPEVFRQFLQWGFEVFKWDCWLNSVRIQDEFRDRCFDKEKSMESCIRDLISAARKVIGNKCYLLGCTIDDRTSLGGAGQWDGFRMGGDVFSWQDFKSNGVDNTFRYYPLHNTRLFLDPDTLVLRKEYSNDDQARTRVAFLALTGMQLTLGDPLNALDDLRIEALKRAMPVAAVHPAELLCKTPPGKLVQTLTAVERSFGYWYIAGAFNFDSRKRKVKIHYRKLGLPAGKYAAFDFWNQRFSGVSETGTEFLLEPGGSAAVRLTPVAGHPVLIGTSRHLLQGAMELTSLFWDEEKRMLSGKVLVVENDPVTLTFYLPENWSVAGKAKSAEFRNIVKLTLDAEKNGGTEWSLRFRKA